MTDETEAEQPEANSPWEMTVADARAMGDARREDDWDAVVLAAEDTAPLSRSDGHTERYGMRFVVSSERAEAFRDLFHRGEFPKYEVYRSAVDGEVFLVVELLDPQSELAILVAGRYDLGAAAGMVHDAEASAEMYTHFQRPDGTYVGTFRHDGHEKFVPHADRIDEFAPE
jgi:hypothetical protein